MRMVLVDTSNVVVDAIMAGQSYTPPESLTAYASDTAGRGDIYDPTTKQFSRPPLAQPSADELSAYARMTQASFLRAGQIFNVAPAGKAEVPILCDGTNPTRADLALMVLSAQASPGTTQEWTDNNGIATSLSSSQVITLATKAGAWVSATYPVLNQVLSAINSSPATITTHDQVVAAFAAIPIP